MLNSVHSQEHDITIPNTDSTGSISSLKDFFEKSHFHGHVRNFFMVTINDSELSDHYANATGAALGFKTPGWKGLQVGVKGLFTFNTFSSDLNGTDSLSHGSAGWEKELFDVMNPYKKSELDRLEEFYLSYRNKKLEVVFGKQDINEGPLLQRRDTRMKPFVYKGIHAGYQVDSLIRLSGSFFSHVSPRGMTEWYSISEAIGLLNSGKTEDGSPLHYHDAVRKVFLIEQGISWKGRKEWEWELWKYQLTGLMHTIWSEWNMSKGKWVFGFQYVQQFADGKQYKLPAESRYFPTNSSQTIAAKVGRDLGRSFSWSVSSTHGIGKGLFLFPRELNRDAFYSSIARSRLDGNGLEHVYLFKIYFRPHKIDWEQWSSRLEIQYSDLAPRSDALHNKYALPDYIQVNVDIKYRFKGILKGLDMEFLYVLRSSRGMDGITLPERFNKTDFHHFNLIINIVF